MTKRSKWLCMGWLLAACLPFSACDMTETIEEPYYVPVLNVSAAAVKASADGGSYSFTYTVNNPAEDGQISCGADVNWIPSIYDSGTGTVSFTVEENTTLEQRSGCIVISYSSSYGTLSKTVMVAQNSGVAPCLTVSPSAVTAEAEGGICSFAYSIDNPPDDGLISCSADVGWIADFDVSVEGTVSFSVAGNEDPNLREGVITVTYVYADGELEELVAVIQSHKPDISGNDDITDEAYAAVGTYVCTGTVSNSNWDHTTDTEPGIEDTWTMKIYAVGGDNLIFNGLVPGISTWYDQGSEYYIAKGKISGDTITVYPQFTGYSTTDSDGNALYVCWAICSAYISNEEADDGNEAGWTYSKSLANPCTFICDTSCGTWTSDYGMFLGMSTSSTSLSGFSGYMDVFAPGMSFTKINDDTDD